MLERTVRAHDAEDLRKIPSARVELRADVQSILDKFNWE